MRRASAPPKNRFDSQASIRQSVQMMVKLVANKGAMATVAGEAGGVAPDDLAMPIGLIDPLNREGRRRRRSMPRVEQIVMQFAVVCPDNNGPSRWRAEKCNSQPGAGKQADALSIAQTNHGGVHRVQGGSRPEKELNLSLPAQYAANAAWNQPEAWRPMDRLGATAPSTAKTVYVQTPPVGPMLAAGSIPASSRARNFVDAIGSLLWTVIRSIRCSASYGSPARALRSGRRRRVQSAR